MNNCIFRVEKRVHDYFKVFFNYDPDIVSLIKKIPTATFNPSDKSWTVKVSNETSSGIKELIHKGSFNCTQDVLDLLNMYEVKSELLFNMSDAEDTYIDLDDTNYNGDLYPFQEVGVNYMLRSKRCFNADDMGLGKTIQTLVAMEKANAYPHIIICPKKAAGKWRREAYKWLPHRTSMVLDNNNFYYDYDILILNFEAVTKFLIIQKRDPERSTFKIRENIKMLGVKGVTVDESHNVKNNKSIRTRAIKKLCKGMEYIWMLSGTFVENKPSEIIPQLQIMRRLDDLGGYKFFINRYCDAKKGFGNSINTSGSSNLIELHNRLKQVCMVRRMKTDVLKELPPKHPSQKIPIEIDNREIYEMAEKDIFSWIEMNENNKNKDSFDLEFEKPNKRLTQDAIELQILNALRVITAEGKINQCIEWIRKFTKRGNKLVVFAHHRKIQNKLIKSFPGCAKILGGMKPSDQKKNEDRFKQKDCKIIVCSLLAANVAIDLVSANHSFTVEYDWKPSTHDQAEDRLWRIGQHKDVYPYYATAVNTIEEDIFALHESKREMMKGIMDGKNYEKTKSIKKELVEILKKKQKVNFYYD